jgi:hypothetical protein
VLPVNLPGDGGRLALGDLNLGAAPARLVLLAIEQPRDAFHGGREIVGHRHVEQRRVHLTAIAGHDSPRHESGHQRDGDRNRDGYQRRRADAAAAAVHARGSGRRAS